MPTFSPRSSIGGLLALGLCVPFCPSLATGEVVTVPHPGRALPLYRNTHATAMACLVDLHGLRKPGEGDRLLIATAALFAEFCECDKPGEPIAWRVKEGLDALLAPRGYRAAIEERVRYASDPDERADLGDYKASIHDGRPVVLTFCYDSHAREGLSQARRRVSDCTSVVGVGYVTAAEKTYLLCHDGLTGEEHQPADGDRVEPTRIGLATDGPWRQPGTSLYAWDGSYANLVMTFVSKPVQQR